MVEAKNSDERRLYLDDLFVGQRFTSRTHVIDEVQIKAFAQQLGEMLVGPHEIRTQRIRCSQSNASLLREKNSLFAQ
jgi:hypothetical protein